MIPPLVLEQRSDSPLIPCRKSPEMQALVKLSDIGHLADFPALIPPDFGSHLPAANAPLTQILPQVSASSASTSDSTSSAEIAASSLFSGSQLSNISIVMASSDTVSTRSVGTASLLRAVPVKHNGSSRNFSSPTRSIPSSAVRAALSDEPPMRRLSTACDSEARYVSAPVRC